MSAEKYQSDPFHKRCQLLSFLFNPWMKYAWSLLANIFLWGGLIFSWLNKCEHASFGRNITSVELAQKNIADLHCKFFMQHQNKKTSSAVKKHCLPASVFKKKLRNVGWKISVRQISRPMSAIEFSIHSENEICKMSVRKCSITVVRWCIFFRPRSFIFPCRRRLSFFFINIGE